MPLDMNTSKINKLVTQINKSWNVNNVSNQLRRIIAMLSIFIPRSWFILYMASKDTPTYVPICLSESEVMHLFNKSWEIRKSNNS